MDEMAEKLLDATLANVPFDGWSQTAVDEAARTLGLDQDTVRSLAPRGAVGLAAAYHRRLDAQTRKAIAEADLSGLGYTDKVAWAVRNRISAGDREAVRRGASLFALPTHAAEGAQLMWGTADMIWDALGDSSEDVNWYSKRATLTAVYSATVLYWLGDQTPGAERTWAFLDRRLADVMRIEKMKAQARRSGLVRAAMDSPLNPLSLIRAPRRNMGSSYPGTWPPAEDANDSARGPRA